MNFVLDTHCHTTASGHAYSTVKEYIDEARAKNLELIAITDHAPRMLGAPTGFHFINLKVIPRFVNGVEVLKGAELSILDAEGAVDLKPETLEQLDIVIASFHPPCYGPVTFEEHTSAAINAMKNPRINIIGHLGDPRYPFDIESVIKTAKETATIIELNNSSFNPGNSRAGGENIVREIIRVCIKHDVYMVAGSDAHFYTELGNFADIMPLIEEMNIPEELMLNTDTERFKAALRMKKAGCEI